MRISNKVNGVAIISGWVIINCLYFARGFFGFDDDNLHKIWLSQVFFENNASDDLAAYFTPSSSNLSTEEYNWFKILPTIKLSQPIASLTGQIYGLFTTPIFHLFNSSDLPVSSGLGIAITLLAISVFVFPSLLVQAITIRAISRLNYDRHPKTTSLPAMESKLKLILLTWAAMYFFWTGIASRTAQKGDGPCFYAFDESEGVNLSLNQDSIFCFASRVLFPTARYQIFSIDSRNHTILAFCLSIFLIGIYKFKPGLRVLALLPWLHFTVGSILLLLTVVVMMRAKLLKGKKRIIFFLINLWNLMFAILFQSSSHGVLGFFKWSADWVFLVFLFFGLGITQVIISMTWKHYKFEDIIVSFSDRLKAVCQLLSSSIYGLLLGLLVYLSLLATILNGEKGEFIRSFLNLLESRLTPTLLALILLFVCTFLAQKTINFSEIENVPASSILSRKSKKSSSASRITKIQSNPSNKKRSFKNLVIFILSPFLITFCLLLSSIFVRNLPIRDYPIFPLNFVDRAEINFEEDLRRIDYFGKVDNYGKQRVAIAWNLYCRKFYRNASSIFVLSNEREDRKREYVMLSNYCAQVRR